MHFTSFLEEGRLTVALDGEIDHHRAKSYIQAIAAKIEAYKPKVCVLSFRDVSFMDSSGIGLILGRNTMMKVLGGKLAIQNPPVQAVRILRLAQIPVEIVQEVTTR